MDKKLTTILCSDVIGYSRMMGLDEVGTLRKLEECRSIVDHAIAEYKGRIFNTAGDAVLAEFSSPTDAVKCAYSIQNNLRDLGNGMRWRIGLHLGEVYAFGDNLMGDTVNIAARIESTADYGGVCLSSNVFEAVSGKLSITIDWRGPQVFKNIKDPIKIYALKIAGAEKNPNAVAKDSIRYSKEQLIKSVQNDKPAIGKTLVDAQMAKRDHQYNPATRILMWRITKKCSASLNELIDMANKELVPKELQEVVVAILSEYCKNIDSDRAIKISKLLQGPLGIHKSLSLKFLKQASITNEEASLNYNHLILFDPYSSENEIKDSVENLTDMGKRKNTKAMNMLCEHFSKTGQIQDEFIWLWVLRGLFETGAQEKLQVLANKISKNDFNTWRINAEALLDEIKFKNDPGNYNY